MTTVGAPVQLTCREMETLRAMAAGKTSRLIGQEMHLTEKTVKTYVLRLFRKLHVHNRAGAVNRAYEIGILHTDADPIPPTADVRVVTVTKTVPAADPRIHRMQEFLHVFRPYRIRVVPDHPFARLYDGMDRLLREEPT